MLNKVNDLVIRGKAKLITGAVAEALEGGCAPEDILTTMIAGMDIVGERFKNGEIFVVGMHISPYEKGNIFNREPRRERKLLMHKREILKLGGLVAQKGYTLVPLSLYFSGKNVKVELGLCRGKKLYDKRDALAEKQADREMDRRMKDSHRSYDD